MSEFTKPYEEKMEGALRHLDKELVSVRAGRANPAILDRVAVDYYGSPTPINQVAAVAVGRLADPRHRACAAGERHRHQPHR